MKIHHYILFAATALLLFSCELHHDMTASVKRKAVVHLAYHYDNGQIETLDGIESMRLFIYDENGILFRDAVLTPEEFCRDTGAMQTYLPNGHYSFVSWANAGGRTSVAPARLSDARLSIATTGADPLLFGRSAAPVVKGDSLVFDINLFKSVFKVNVRVVGLDAALYPEDHYFGIMNRSGLTFDNKPSGEMKQYRPELIYKDGILAGSFYTPYFAKDDDFTIGVYCDDPDSQYTTLCQTTIRKFAEYTEGAVGKDVVINVDILINTAGIVFIVTDWEGTVIQEEHVGS